ncbi:glycosyltransferase family 4 protein [Syntrophomonas erecta]
MVKTRVLHVIGGGEIGGAEELVLTLMRLLDKSRYEPHLICLCPGPFVEVARKEGFPAQLIPMRNKLDITTVGPVQDYIFDHTVDIVHTHGVRANLVARIAGHSLGVPVVTTVHSVLRYDYDTWFKAVFARFLTKLTNRYTDRFIAISDAIRQEIESMQVAPERIEVIHNGLDTSKFVSPRPPEQMQDLLGLNPNLKIITMVARLHPVKGHEYFLRAARQVLDRYPGVQFLIIGEGPERGNITRLVNELGLNERVRMPGYYTPIEDIYGVSDLLCVPSIMEGLGLVILEAMYFRVPVVASAIGGILEIIEDGKDGILVPPRDPSALAGAILALLKDEQRAERLKDGGQEKIKNFTLKNMAQQVEQIYAELV